MMNSEERKRTILELVNARSFASVHDLETALGVSAATVRRDIDAIHASGEARKVHGGISAKEGPVHAERTSARSYDENQDLAVDAKRAIAATAETLVRDGDTVIINAGTTCFHLGVRLAHRNVRICTNSMPLIVHLATRGTCPMVVSGGDFHRESSLLYNQTLPSSFYASKYFVGAQGISTDGLLESHPLLVRAVTETAQRSDEVVVLADSRKFSVRLRHSVLPLARVSTLVTDDGLTDADARILEDAGVTILVAQRQDRTV
jgi:DeoR family ulaG and ulaABCDEF operon transcriptional repressor